MLTSTERHWHDQYEALPANTKEAIDEAWLTMSRELRAAGIACANDDRAEVLIAALTRYVVESRT